MDFTVSLFVRVFDETALLRAAAAHVAEHHPGALVTDPADALVMLLDPGGGGAAYQGNLNDAGFEIIESSAE